MNSFADRNAYLNGHDILYTSNYHIIQSVVLTINKLCHCRIVLMQMFICWQNIALHSWCPTTVGKVTYMTAINYQDMSLSIRHQLRILLNPAKFIADSFVGRNLIMSVIFIMGSSTLTPRPD